MVTANSEIGYDRMHKTTRLKIVDVNPHLQCVLCGGYFVDATCIIECLHSFCRSCITKYLEGSKCCPICDVQVHKTRPLLNLRPDKTLQTLVYKLIPGLYRQEMSRRREFYAKYPDAAPSPSLPNASEERGESDPDRFQSQEEPEKISLILQHCDRLPLPSNSRKRKGGHRTKTTSDKRCLLCPSVLSVAHLKKFLRCKFDIQQDYQIELFHNGDETLPEDYTLADVAYVYGWTRKEPLQIFYVVLDTREVCLDLSAPVSLPIVVPKPGESDPQGESTHGVTLESPAQRGLDSVAEADTEVAADEPDPADASTEVNTSLEACETEQEQLPAESRPVSDAQKTEEGTRLSGHHSPAVESCGREGHEPETRSPVFTEQDGPVETPKEHSRKHSHKKKKKKKKHKRSRSKEESEAPEEPKSVIKVRIPKDKISPLVFRDSVFDAPNDSADEDESQFDFAMDSVGKSAGVLSVSPGSEGRASGSLEDSGVDPGEDLMDDLVPDRRSSLDSLSPKTPKISSVFLNTRLDNTMEYDHVDSQYSENETSTGRHGIPSVCKKVPISQDVNMNKCYIDYGKDNASTSNEPVERITCSSHSPALESHLPELKDYYADSPDIICMEEMSFFTDSETESSLDSSQPGGKEYTCELSLDGKVLLHSSNAKSTKPKPLPAAGIVVEDTPPEIIVVDSDTGLHVDTVSVPSNGYQSCVSDNPVLDSRSLDSVTSPSRQNVSINDQVETDLSVLVEVDESGSLVHSALPRAGSPSELTKLAPAGSPLSPEQTRDNSGGVESKNEPLSSARTDAHSFKKQAKVKVKQEVDNHVPLNVHSSLSPPFGRNSLKRPKVTESSCVLKQPKLTGNHVEHSHQITADLVSKVDSTSSTSSASVPYTHITFSSKTPRVTAGVHSSLSPPTQQVPQKAQVSQSTSVSVEAHGHTVRESVSEAGPVSASTTSSQGHQTSSQRQTVPATKRSPRRGPLKERPVTLPMSRAVTPVKSCAPAPIPRPYSSLPYPLYQTHVHPSLSAITAPGAFSPPPAAMKQLRLMCGDVGLLPPPVQLVRQALPHGFPLHSGGFLHSRHFLSPIFSAPMPSRSLPSPLSPARASPLSPSHFAPVSPAHFGVMSPPRLSPPGLPGLVLGGHLQMPGYDSPLELTTRNAQDRHSASVSSERS